jgi:hypothetical protein
MPIIDWSHSPWQPAMQSMAFGSHVVEQLESQNVVHMGSGGTCAVQPPVQPTSNSSGVHSALQLAETSILQSRPCEKSNPPQGLPPSAARADRAPAIDTTAATASASQDGA